MQTSTIAIICLLITLLATAGNSWALVRKLNRIEKIAEQNRQIFTVPKEDDPYKQILYVIRETIY